MSLQWFPGHMAKAKRQIAEVLPKIDLVIEVLDARLPISSANPVLKRLRRGKPCLKILNKSDLADAAVTRQWLDYFHRAENVRALPLEATRRASAAPIRDLCRQMVPQRGKPGKTLRVMVAGIPNVGKSTLINTLAGRRIARVGDKPAITTCPQQVDLRNGIQLADTPGLLWPNINSQTSAYRLAASGAIGDAAIDAVAVASFAAEYLLAHYSQSVAARYRMASLPATPAELLAEIGRQRGCLAAGGTIDVQRAAAILLRELRTGLIGRISFESPSDFPEEPTDDR
ncbi:MAG: ribosome biogenesis GTPase YlqF [Desulfuromonadales bacterium]|jgi:ribosome biogenesis GTPase A